PDANLDVEGEKALAQTILHLRQAGKIPIVISHRPNILSALNMALLIFQGRMIAFGSRDQVFQQLGRNAQQQQQVPPPAPSAPGGALNSRVAAAPAAAGGALNSRVTQQGRRNAAV
ncbi:MAG: type I secretion system permease/ATPase, partial [Bradyrhizobiaceae bacterium]|nr:type I secretion system permease/ATPase [Bradyrhizobiaceae bacterium]